MAEPPAGISVHPVPGLPEFAPGDDLAAAVATAAPWLADGDVVVVTSKVVSKVEGRLVSVEPGQDRELARQRAIEQETVRVVARRGPLAIVETPQGWVVAAAGIDASNVGQDALVLLPADGDASARALRARLHELLGVDVAVVVSDTFGRTWREGLTDVAVGAAGITALADHRGAVDAWGNRLETTRVAVVDELASAADLV
jgi:coenzyme F420-0:L-glutamate ligase/coenzyme F420-1:gamma-L-glutamate ligase